LPRGPLWLLSPRLAPWQKKIVRALKARVPRDPDTVWVLSSGTQSVNQVKAIGLKREAILASCAGVNRHLGVTAADRWLIAIPTYHVGGFSILGRAFLSGSRTFTLASWSAEGFLATVERRGITLCSLVPTQIHDLVAAGLRSPPCLRAIVVGGGALDEPLYRRARALGWPVLTSYGLTETASQVATAPLSSLSSGEYPAMAVLPHACIELRGDRVGTSGDRVWIQASSLCHWVAVADLEGRFSLEDPRREGGWLPTEDLGQWVSAGAAAGSPSGPGLRLLGRRDDVVKVFGVLVQIAQVEGEVRAFFAARGLERTDLAVLAVPSAREGNALLLVTDTVGPRLPDLTAALDAFNAQAPGPHRPRQLVWVPEIPRTDLGKVKRAELKALLGLSGSRG
jgi:O-succinylbenzoic acid--CoA ligase